MLKIFSVTAFVIEGYVIKKMQEDGSCLFRAVADQIYGDEEMHSCVRGHCMDYIVSLSVFYGLVKLHQEIYLKQKHPPF